MLIGANDLLPICFVGAGGAAQKPCEQRFDDLAGWTLLSLGECRDTVSRWRQCYASLLYVQVVLVKTETMPSSAGSWSLSTVHPSGRDRLHPKINVLLQILPAKGRA